MGLALQAHDQTGLCDAPFLTRVRYDTYTKGRRVRYNALHLTRSWVMRYSFLISEFWAPELQ